MSAKRCLSLDRRRAGARTSTVERPLQRHVEHDLRDAHHLRGLDHDRELQLALHVGGCGTGRAGRGAGVDAHAVELHPSVPTGQVDALERRDRHAGRVGRDELREAVAEPRVTNRRSACAAASTGACDPPRTNPPPSADRDARADRVAHRLADHPCGHDLTRRSPPERLGPLLIRAAPRQRRRHDIARQQRARRGVAPERVGHQREVDHSAAMMLPPPRSSGTSNDTHPGSAPWRQ